MAENNSGVSIHLKNRRLTSNIFFYYLAFVLAVLHKSLFIFLMHLKVCHKLVRLGLSLTSAVKRMTSKTFLQMVVFHKHHQGGQQQSRSRYWSPAKWKYFDRIVVTSAIFMFQLALICPALDISGSIIN